MKQLLNQKELENIFSNFKILFVLDLQLIKKTIVQDH